MQPEYVSFVAGLILLLPGVVALGVRSYLGRRGRPSTLGSAQAAAGARGGAEASTAASDIDDPNPLLIIVILVTWTIAFGALWLLAWRSGLNALVLFHEELEFYPFVPFFGLLGAMIFVIDLFRGKKTINVDTEFAMRLVLGPYVALVIVLLFQGSFSFVNLTGVKAQAALAFLSGFLVVLFLQGLTERGNELLGRWRESSRYEPSEIARRFGLDMQDDLKVRQDGNLKYLEQLRTLPDSWLRERGKAVGLGEGLLVEYKKNVEIEYLEAALGETAWEKLKREGLDSARDIATTTREHLREVAEKQKLNAELLEDFRVSIQRLVAPRDGSSRGRDLQEKEAVDKPGGKAA